MRRLAPIILTAAVSAIGLAACEDTYDNGYGYGYGSSSYGYGPYGYAYVDGYYDNFYGPFYEGYWGPDAYFYYRTAPSSGFIRDDEHHFRRDSVSGYHPFHARAAHATPQAAPRRYDRDRDDYGR